MGTTSTARIQAKKTQQKKAKPKKNSQDDIKDKKDSKAPMPGSEEPENSCEVDVESIHHKYVTLLVQDLNSQLDANKGDDLSSLQSGNWWKFRPNPIVANKLEPDVSQIYWLIGDLVKMLQRFGINLAALCAITSALLGFRQHTITS